MEAKFVFPLFGHRRTRRRFCNPEEADFDFRQNGGAANGKPGTQWEDLSSSLWFERVALYIFPFVIFFALLLL